MKALLAFGLVVLSLGILSLFVPVPHRERSGLRVGEVSVGITTEHDEKVSPIVSAIMIVGGVGMLIAWSARRPAGSGS